MSNRRALALAVDGGTRTHHPANRRPKTPIRDPIAETVEVHP